MGVSTQKWLVALLLLPASITARAQSKATFPWTAYAGAQLNCLTAAHHVALLRVRAERSFDREYNGLLGADNANRTGGAFQRLMVQGGFEWLLNERWTGGVIEKINFDPASNRTFQTGAFLRHCGHIGAVQFRKRALAEHVARNQWQPNAAQIRLPNAAQIRLRVDFDRDFPLNPALLLRPRLSYEAQFNFSWEKTAAGAPAPEERTVNRGFLRLEMAVIQHENLALVPFVQKQIDYVIAVEQRDGQNQITVPAGPRNLRTPIVGLEVRYTMARNPADLHTLPTYEGFQD